MQNQSSAEENIDRLLTHFQQQSQYQAIQEWRQQIEDKEARVANQPPRTINVEHAVQDFRRALLADTAHSESAKQLLRDLNRPAQPKFTAIEAWRLQNPANRPACLTPEQQTYVDRYDRNEQERRKWCVEISTDRWERWGVLEESIQDYRKRAEKALDHGDAEGAKHFTQLAETSGNELRTDVANVGEQWWAENPELVRLLIDQFIGKSWVTRVPTKDFKEYQDKQFPDHRPLSSFVSDARASCPVFPQEAFYRDRLYFIAANLILKHFGLEDEVAHSLLDDLQKKAFQERDTWYLGLGTESDQEARVTACKIVAGRAYWDIYEQLQKDGIGSIRMLESYLSDALSNLLKDPDQVNDPSTTPLTVSDSNETLDRTLWKKSANHYRIMSDPERKQKEEEREDATKQKHTILKTILEAVKTQLTPRQRTILLLLEQGYTHESIAKQLGCNQKTIQRDRRKIEDLARQLRAQRRL